ncbi:hypothetical protein EF10244_08880 [Enterococcus faecalis 10244]|nr:hypothetical protein EF10244_08880 [Enterococcus faecalis 10244]
MDAGSTPAVSIFRKVEKNKKRAKTLQNKGFSSFYFYKKRIKKKRNAKYFALILHSDHFKVYFYFIKLFTYLYIQITFKITNKKIPTSHNEK